MYKFDTLFLGQSVYYLPSCHSTNDIAMSLISQSSALEGTVVITDQQTAGRGQQGNHWEAEPHQNITLSVILHPTFLQAKDQFWLNIAISLGIFDFLGQYLDDSLKIKWPNDIYYNNQKLCGILIQNLLSGHTLRYAIAGIGININQTKFQNVQATSLKLQTQEEYSLKSLTEALLKFLEIRYLQLRNSKYDSIKYAYLQSLYWYQESHVFEAFGEQFEGKIIGIDSIGRLCVEKTHALHYFNFKEIKFIT